MHRRRMQDFHYPERNDDGLSFRKPPDHQQFHTSLDAAKSMIMCQIQESGRNLLSFPKAVEQNNIKTKLLLTSVHEEPIHRADGKP